MLLGPRHRDWQLYTVSTAEALYPYYCEMHISTIVRKVSQHQCTDSPSRRLMETWAMSNHAQCSAAGLATGASVMVTNVPSGVHLTQTPAARTCLAANVNRGIVKMIASRPRMFVG